MTEPGTQEPTGTPLAPPAIETLTQTAFAIISNLLGAYGFREDAPDGAGGDGDYRIVVNREDSVLALDIDANAPIRGLLIGRRGSNVLALERILISALFRRLCPEKGQKLGRTIRLSVNGTRPDAKRENGDEERPAEKKVVTVIVPLGVELRALNPDGTSR